MGDDRIGCGFLGLCLLLGCVVALILLVTTADRDKDKPPPEPAVGTSVPVRMPDGSEYECNVMYGTTIVFSDCQGQP